LNFFSRAVIFKEIKTFCESEGRELVPKNFFLTKGIGIHHSEDVSRELAMRSAGIERLNLRKNANPITIPPGCKMILPEEGLRLLSPGISVDGAYEVRSTNESMRLIAAAVGVAMPVDVDQCGYAYCRGNEGETDEKSGDIAEDCAATMLASALGVEFDPDGAWDEREKIYRLSGKIIKPTNCTQSAKGPKDDVFISVVSCLIFVPSDPFAELLKAANGLKQAASHLIKLSQLLQAA